MRDRSVGWRTTDSQHEEVFAEPELADGRGEGERLDEPPWAIAVVQEHLKR
jgi:hypothetical protein